MTESLGDGNASPGAGAMRPERARCAALRGRLYDLALRASNVDLRRFETPSAASEWVELRDVTIGLLDETMSFVSGEVTFARTVDSIPPSTRTQLRRTPSLLPFERAVDAATLQGSGAPSWDLVEDIAFMVQLELRQRRDRLTQVSQIDDPATGIAECDSALRRVRKGLGALDLALARFDESPPILDFSSECQDSLRVRRAYAKFRARFPSREEKPSPEELVGKMRAAGNHIAVLIGWEAYPLLRVRDRLQLRELQHRVLSWLRSPERSAVDGQRIWQDLSAFVSMLAQVNMRQELIEHDARLLTESIAELRAGSSDLSAEVMSALGPLHGRDPELDALIQSRNGTRSAWLSALERVARQLRAAEKAR